MSRALLAVMLLAVAACASDRSQVSDKDLSSFQSELGWREFSYHLLYYNPDLANQNYQSRFNDFPWMDHPDHLTAWQSGLTGYPIVDAGMRELWHTGWMHNRVRMVVGSFLVKHLLIPWQEGAEWFWDTLVDANLANNTLGWQWIAGCGADAAPYFRIFNPVTQGLRFDPDGSYVRTFIPELPHISGSQVHEPWDVIDGYQHDYPERIVDHSAERDESLRRYEAIKGK